MLPIIKDQNFHACIANGVEKTSNLGLGVIKSLIINKNINPK